MLVVWSSVLIGQQRHQPSGCSVRCCRCDRCLVWCPRRAIRASAGGLRADSPGADVTVSPDFAPSGGSIPQIRPSASSPSMQSPRSRQTSVGWVDRAVLRVTRPASNNGLPWRLEGGSEYVGLSALVKQPISWQSCQVCTHNRVCRERLVFRASARCRVRLMLETTPRFRLS